MGLVWVGDRGTCPPIVFVGGGQKALCPPPHVLQGKIFFTLKIFRLVTMTNSVKKAMYFGGLVKKAKVFQGGSQIFA